MIREDCQLVVVDSIGRTNVVDPNDSISVIAEILQAVSQMDPDDIVKIELQYIGN